MGKWLTAAERQLIEDLVIRDVQMQRRFHNGEISPLPMERGVYDDERRGLVPCTIISWQLNAGTATVAFYIDNTPLGLRKKDNIPLRRIVRFAPRWTAAELDIEAVPGDMVPDTWPLVGSRAKAAKAETSTPARRLGGRLCGGQAHSSPATHRPHYAALAIARCRCSPWFGGGRCMGRCESGEFGRESLPGSLPCPFAHAHLRYSSHGRGFLRQRQWPQRWRWRTWPCTPARPARASCAVVVAP